MSKTDSSEEFRDPIVEEVRAARQAIFEQCGNDLHRYFEFIREVEKRNPGRIVRSVEELRERTAQAPSN